MKANKMEQETKGFIVYTINVGQASPKTVERQSAEWMEKLNTGRPDGWQTVLIPSRALPSKVEVFSLQDGVLEEIKPHILKETNLTFPVKEEESTEQITNYVLLKLGHPVVDVWSLSLEEEILSLIEEAKQFQVGKVREYVYHHVKELYGQ